MNRIVEELKKAGVFYVATVEGDQPRVRPFGAVSEINGSAYICTNNTKPVYRQLAANPKAEISAMLPTGEWLRITAKIVRDDSDAAREAMLKDNPSLGGMYHIGDGIFEVLRLEDVKGCKCSFTAPPEEL